MAHGSPQDLRTMDLVKQSHSDNNVAWNREKKRSDLSVARNLRGPYAAGRLFTRQPCFILVITCNTNFVGSWSQELVTLLGLQH